MLLTLVLWLYSLRVLLGMTFGVLRRLLIHLSFLVNLILLVVRIGLVLLDYLIWLVQHGIWLGGLVCVLVCCSLRMILVLVVSWHFHLFWWHGHCLSLHHFLHHLWAVHIVDWSACYPSVTGSVSCTFEVKDVTEP